MMDTYIDSLIKKEINLESSTLRLIPSENYVSKDVRLAVGSILMNKYAEGQSGKRYYQGNEFIDEIEVLCKKRALQFFGISADNWGVNVQAHSGSPANLAAFTGLLQLGDTIMSMYLPEGGHLSHGWQLPNNKVTLVSKIFNISFYHVDQSTLLFDYDAIEKQALEVLPKLIVSGGTAYPRTIDHKRLSEISKKVGAYYLADIAHEAGLIGAGEHPTPFPYADVVTMTTHKTLRGPRGAIIISRKELSPLIDKAVFPGMQGGPHMHTIAGIAVALQEALQPEFKTYAHQVILNAKLLGELFVKAGYNVVSGGTDKHLLLLDLRNKDLSGWVGAWALEYAGIIANRNSIPFDTSSPFYPSGLRLGTPAVTTRGMKEEDMVKISDWCIKVLTYAEKWKLPEEKEARKAFTKSFLEEVKKDAFLLKIKKEVEDFTKGFPIP